MWKRLNVLTFELRRQYEVHAILFWCYKIVFGLVHINVDDFFWNLVGVKILMDTNITSSNVNFAKRCLSVQCIVEKRRIESGCRLAS